MYALSYLINNSFCLLIMAFIFVCHLRGPDTRQSTGLFCAMVIGMMAFTVLDMLCGLQENGAIRPTRWCVEVLFPHGPFHSVHGLHCCAGAGVHQYPAEPDHH